MIPAWTDEDLRCLARDHRNDPDVLDLIAGVRRVLALCAHYGLVPTSDVLAALNDPNGATP